ncbi:MAG: PIN domain-containing protein [Anaerolineales bacterium]
MKVYLDACCINRPFDDQRQLRIRLESEAVIIVLEKFQSREWVWLSSEVLLYELSQNPDVENRQRTLMLAGMADQVVALDEAILQRAEKLQEAGFSAYDALHLACAEAGEADIFLTTDDRIVKLARKKKGLLRLAVDNPVRWLDEVLR